MWQGLEGLAKPVPAQVKIFLPASYLNLAQRVLPAKLAFTCLENLFYGAGMERQRKPGKPGFAW